MMLEPNQTLVIASHNQGKVREIAELLAPFELQVQSASEYPDLIEPEENAPDFIGNALIKAEYVSKHTGHAALSDDSGLVVPALNGAPGIYSARWAGENKDFTMAMQRVERELQEVHGTTAGHEAHFVCALALCVPGKAPAVVEGYVHGVLQFPQTGEKGFGYDSIFLPDGYTESFGEMDSEKKQALSHRNDAFKKLLSLLR